jgi:eukaryotic-like serine/threonine-protein kinase
VQGRFLAVAGRLFRALLLLALFVLTAYLSFNLWVRRGATPVPDLTGLGEEQARTALVEHGLAFRRADFERFSDRVPPGDVLETRPAAGSYVKRGAEIEVVMSRGEHRVAVPDLGGKSRAAARLMLEGQSLTEGATLEVYSTRGPAGTVVGQDPAPGREIPAGAPVALLVARDGSAPAWVMPDLVSRRYEPVRAALEAQGFRFGNVAIEPYEGAVAGTILRQTPPPGHPLRREDAVSIVVSGERGGLGS